MLCFPISAESRAALSDVHVTDTNQAPHHTFPPRMLACISLSLMRVTTACDGCEPPHLSTSSTTPVGSFYDLSYRSHCSSPSPPLTDTIDLRP